MAEQSFLNKMGMRLGILGSAASLAIAAPLANGDYNPSCHTDAARIGVYFDRTLGSEKIALIVGGNTGPIFTRNGSAVDALFGGTVTIGMGTAGVNFNMNGAAATTRRMAYQTAGLNRWTLDTDATAESGSDAGSNFIITAWSDAGTVIDTPMTMIRAALGAITFARPTAITAGTLTGSETMTALSATWNNGASSFVGMSVDITDTASAVGSLLFRVRISAQTAFSVAKTGAIIQGIVDTDLLATGYYLITRTSTLTGNVTDGINISLAGTVNGAFTVTRYNYILIQNTTGTSTITNGCVLRFNAAAGTHKAVDAATTKTTPGAVDAWMKHNINSTVFFQPLYLSKTA